MILLSYSATIFLFEIIIKTSIETESQRVRRGMENVDEYFLNFVIPRSTVTKRIAYRTTAYSLKCTSTGWWRNFLLIATRKRDCGYTRGFPGQSVISKFQDIVHRISYDFRWNGVVGVTCTVRVYRIWKRETSRAERKLPLILYLRFLVA